MKIYHYYYYIKSESEALMTLDSHSLTQSLTVKCD